MRGTSHRSSGNVLFIILIAIALIAALTAVLTRSEQGGSNLTSEKTSIAVSQMSSFALDIKRAVENMTRAGISESAISFAQAKLTGYGTPDTTPKNEVFNIAGGGAGYIDVPEGISNGSQWEFAGFTAAPGVGDEAVPDLMLILPNVNEKFCRTYNKKAGYADSDPIPTDSSACLYDTSKRFNGSFATSGINVMDSSSFRKPAGFACVSCGGTYHAYYVLMDR